MMDGLQQQVLRRKDSTGTHGHLNILKEKLENEKKELADREAENQRLLDQLIVLNEKIEDSGVDMKAVMTNPQGTKFEFQVLQIVIPAEYINADLAQGFDPETLKLLYSVSDSKQDQFFATKATATVKVEQAGIKFYRAIFKEKFTFTVSEEATDTLSIKVFATITTQQQVNDQSAEQQASPVRIDRRRGSDELQTSERMLECLKFRLKDNLYKFFNQQETLQEMKQTKCKLAFKGRWLHNEDLVKFESKKEEYERKYQWAQQKKRKIEKAENMFALAKHQATMQQSNAVMTEQSTEVISASQGETPQLSLTSGGNGISFSKSVSLSGLSMSANKQGTKRVQPFGRVSLIKPMMQNIPEEGQGSSRGKVDGEQKKFAAPTFANIQKYSSTMPKGAGFGTRSFAKTEKHSMRSYMSSLSSMSNFLRVTDSPFGGVIPSTVLRAAMEKRQQEILQEGAAEQNVTTTNEEQPTTPAATHDIMNTSQGQQGSAGDTTQQTINQQQPVRQQQQRLSKPARISSGKGQSYQSFMPRSVTNIPLATPFLMEAMRMTQLENGRNGSREETAKNMTSAQIIDQYQKVASARGAKTLGTTAEVTKEERKD